MQCVKLMWMECHFEEICLSFMLTFTAFTDIHDVTCLNVSQKTLTITAVLWYCQALDNPV